MRMPSLWILVTCPGCTLPDPMPNPHPPLHWETLEGPLQPARQSRSSLRWSLSKLLVRYFICRYLAAMLLFEKSVWKDDFTSLHELLYDSNYCPTISELSLKFFNIQQAQKKTKWRNIWSWKKSSSKHNHHYSHFTQTCDQYELFKETKRTNTV